MPLCIPQADVPVITRSLPASVANVGISERPSVRGKFLFVGEEKLYIRGVTYGTFRSGQNGVELVEEGVVARDFAGMAAAGINAIRTYTVPSRRVLDLAQAYGLWVLVGLPWEQHIAFLDGRERRASIEATVRAGVRTCAGHPAVLGYAIGNEIPASIVRWYGPTRIERFLERLCRAVRDEAPTSLVTYVNYPSTEYLQLPFLDFVAFNVYLESIDRLRAYLARLQNVADDRPLLLAEVGVDSRRHGRHVQSEMLEGQIRTTFASGSAGIFVFAWTDEWHRGGHEIEDWDFGLTTRDRQAKPALAGVERAFADVPFGSDIARPRISVVVCTYNGSRTLGDACEGLARQHYPNYEVIVVDDGSTDTAGAIARRAGFRVIRTENRGLSSARNTGLEAATGQIVAYCDDDARPDPDWLSYLAATFQRTEFAGVGGPNISPAGDGWVAECVANAPGGPVHVLLTDEVAEHIPGCNMAFRRSALQAVGGFDPNYRVAGDDVDVCWRLQDRGWELGFSPAAVVWHHRRASVKTYWKQQVGYGRAEALLERKWPEKYNSGGHLDWNGRVYSRGVTQPLLPRGRIYQGIWGMAPFQRLYESSPHTFHFMTLMPEWYLVIGLLAGLTLLGLAWMPLLLFLPLLLAAIAVPAVQAIRSARRARFSSRPASRANRVKMRTVTALLHLIQPAARLSGRIRNGLHLWRRHGRRHLSLPWRGQLNIWSERWRPTELWLQQVSVELARSGALTWHGSEFDRWDLEVRRGALGSARALMTVEEHGAGRQLLRFRIWPRVPPVVRFLIIMFTGVAVVAFTDRANLVGVVFGDAAMLLIIRTLYDLAGAVGALRMAVTGMDPT